MSIYSDISKSIGFHQGVSIRIPEITTSNQLLEQVKKGDVDAFREVFRIYRYASAAETDLQHRSKEVICEAFKIGCQNPQWK